MMKPPRIGDKYITRNGQIAEIATVGKMGLTALVTNSGGPNPTAMCYHYNLNLDCLSDANFDLMEWVKPKT
jgi:hypothetical protein